MAAGSFDAHGIWQYGEDDQRDTFSELLNIGQGSVSDAIGIDRARIDSLSSTGTLGPVDSGVFTAGPGWAINGQQARKKNGLVFWRILFTRSGAPITPAANGDLTNTLIATIGGGWLPATGMTYPAVTAENGPVIAGGVLDSGGWGVWLAAVGPGLSIATSSQYTLSGIYPLA